MNQAPQNNDHLNETMLYKCPGPHEFQGVSCDYVIVPEVDIEKAQTEGWHRSIPEARAAHDLAVLASFEEKTKPAPAPISETAHLLQSQANAEHLETSIEQANAGQVQVRELIEEAATIIGLDHKELNAPPTYDEMKAQAKQMGLEFQGNISKAALLAMINAKLAEQV